MTGRLSGKTAIVTGGTQGIGLAIVRRFAAEGANVVVVARNRFCEEQGSRRWGPGEIVFRQGDVSDEDTARGVVGEAVSRFGSVQVLVNNAGIDWTGDLMDATL